MKIKKSAQFALMLLLSLTIWAILIFYPRLILICLVVAAVISSLFFDES